MESIVLAKSGDRNAMGEIIEKFTPFVIKRAKSIYIKGWDFEDIIQMANVSIIKAVNMFDTDKSNGFISYVTNTITRNFYTLIRDNVKRTSYCSLNSLNKEGSELIDIIASDEDMEEDFIRKEENRRLIKALSKLSEKEKEIIYWFYFEGRTLQDYANSKGVGYRTAVDRKKRALIKLRTIMKTN
jgi:RNA polymerase sigma factor (sigma-70 family)